MARKPRLEFPGALYHIISRGNYRKAIFDGGAGEAFEKALFEACGKCGWLLHAYVIMANHYHLALETPAGNLVEGMRWLQGSFGIRFNAFHGEHGHVFQSRYKSILIEEGRPLLGLVNYIHLNPVRAGIVDIPNLAQFKLSSFPKFLSPTPPEFLVRARFLSALEFPDSATGMKRYTEFLERSEENDPAKRDELTQRYHRGWAVASGEYRSKLKTMFADKKDATPLEGSELAEVREVTWERLVVSLLQAAEKTESDLHNDTKSAPWKVRIAHSMRTQSTATNAWLANRLAMGHPTRVCNLIRNQEKAKGSVL